MAQEALPSARGSAPLEAKAVVRSYGGHFGGFFGRVQRSKKNIVFVE